jgi:hypothetical protein
VTRADRQLLDHFVEPAAQPSPQLTGHRRGRFSFVRPSSRFIKRSTDHVQTLVTLRSLGISHSTRRTARTPCSGPLKESGTMASSEARLSVELAILPHVWSFVTSKYEYALIYPQLTHSTHYPSPTLGRIKHPLKIEPPLDDEGTSTSISTE